MLPSDDAKRISHIPHRVGDGDFCAMAMATHRIGAADSAFLQGSEGLILYSAAL